jgi:hypothetical protein
MENMKEYLFGVICAAMISAVITRLLRGNHTASVITKLLCGLFIVYTAIKPLPMLDFPDLAAITSQYTKQARQAVQQGIDQGETQLKESIKERTRAYILAKAQTLDADLQVEVEVSDEEIPVPKTVALAGKISPYAKQQLSEMIRQDLGIGMEYQQWN